MAVLILVHVTTSVYTGVTIFAHGGGTDGDFIDGEQSSGGTVFSQHKLQLSHLTSTEIKLYTSTYTGSHSGLDIDISVYTPIEPEVTSDFPVDDSLKATIPRIIHQIWNNYTIPTQIVENIPVLINHHPQWDYYFWTLDSGRLFIKTNFPGLLDIYDSYTEHIDRSDLLRYAILYHYGGVFLDLDFYALRSLDRVIASYPCVVVREPPEQAVFLYNVDFFLANGVLFTRPRHPLFQQIIDNIAVFRHNQRPCGTRMFTTNYLIYNRTKYAQAKTPENDVYVAPSKYFIDKIDPGLHTYFRKACKTYKESTPLKQRGCASYVRNYVSQNSSFSYAFTKHLWAHTIKHLNFSAENDIRKIAPSAKFYAIDESV